MKDSAIASRMLLTKIAINVHQMHGDSRKKDASVISLFIKLSINVFLLESYNFRNQVCNCNPWGSKNDFCDQQTGKCDCFENIKGHKCSECENGHYNFPKCEQCKCNGYSNSCSSDGVCLECSGHTEGFYCER